jgi:RNA polymerase sigma-70 factor, ECF subfamily
MLETMSSPAVLADPDELRLVDGLRRGDEAAFMALVRRYGPQMLRVARMYVASEAAAEDVVQETWLAVLKGIDRFEGRSSLRTWLLSIARRVCADAVRTRRRRPFSLVRDDADLEALAGGDGPDSVGEGAVVTDLLGRLDADRREAFVLTQLLGLSYAEAAAVADCPVGTIRSRVARARGDLIDALADDTRGEEATGR